MAATVTMTNPKNPAGDINQARHFSIHRVLFACATVISASPQRTMEK
jgi:hypothetical protein